MLCSTFLLKKVIFEVIYFPLTNIIIAYIAAHTPIMIKYICTGKIQGGQSALSIQGSHLGCKNQAKQKLIKVKTIAIKSLKRLYLNSLISLYNKL